MDDRLLREVHSEVHEEWMTDDEETNHLCIVLPAVGFILFLVGWLMWVT